jgi:hypothetical protein
MKAIQHILLPVLIFLVGGVFAQTNRPIAVSTDSSTQRKNPAFTVDTIKKNNKVDSIPKHDPRKATLRSALVPGWGQAYNKEYWKIPLVYAAIGVPTGFYIYNATWYNRTKLAFDIAVTGDTVRLPHPKLRKAPTTSNEQYASSMRFYRNEFRKNKDYSILYLLLAWGLNVADATVFGHLKDFDVSDDLSFKIKPGHSPLANTTGLSLILAVKNSDKLIRNINP